MVLFYKLDKQHLRKLNIHLHVHAHVHADADADADALHIDIIINSNAVHCFIRLDLIVVTITHAGCG